MVFLWLMKEYDWATWQTVLGALIFSIFWASITSKLSLRKGYVGVEKGGKYFWTGFFLWFLGFLYVGFLPVTDRKKMIAMEKAVTKAMIISTSKINKAITLSTNKINKATARSLTRYIHVQSTARFRRHPFTPKRIPRKIKPSK